MKNEDQKEKFLIFGFLRKILRKEEMEEFQTHLKEEEFQDRVSEETVNQYGRNQLKSKLDNIHLEVAKDQKKKRYYLRLILVFAAALLVFFCWNYISNRGNIQNVNSDQIFALYFEPYASLYDQKGETAIEEQGLILAMKAYSDRNYSKAVDLFEVHFSENTTKKSLTSFYYGIALLADNQNDKALGVLSDLKKRSSTNSLLPKEPLDWYLALTYLNRNNMKQALPLLENLASQKKNSFKQEEAKDILQKLGN